MKVTKTDKPSTQAHFDHIVNEVSGKLQKVEERLDNLEKRFITLEKKVDWIMEKIDWLVYLFNSGLHRYIPI